MSFISILSYHFVYSKKDPELLPKTIGCLSYMISDENTTVAKRVMLASNSLYKVALQVSNGISLKILISVILLIVGRAILRICDIFYRIQRHMVFSKVERFLKLFWERISRAKDFMDQRLTLTGKTVREKKIVKVWRFSKVKFKRNEWEHQKEHEILSKKLYYNKSLTQTHEEIRPFKVKYSVKSITV